MGSGAETQPFGAPQAASLCVGTYNAGHSPLRILVCKDPSSSKTRDLCTSPAKEVYSAIICTCDSVTTRCGVRDSAPHLPAPILQSQSLALTRKDDICMLSPSKAQTLTQEEIKAQRETRTPRVTHPKRLLQLHSSVAHLLPRCEGCSNISSW